MEGSTFTLSNLGLCDIESFTVIINSPETRILAVGKIASRPFVLDSKLKVALILKTTLSVNHRIVDG